ncbi:uncharacterized protein Z520_08610 [Fonsecaea multimorphosa CBS 102226]|uniref:Uncharacterized protein n=1 Tax=Fonsecaea multimorphosa CBS 102226 TaxID=1442371 RepID=A0A0D2H0Z6_9EURO|nr:uncharacterized protein Z520_08610 [Fonsecaea multimorphosa CBS 102226]KIX95490.1 hypothetical protein Z520_08610 [Fonsecaea multimorphosa CBS 102226]OAL21336.1 hypothetical protein AYO22_08059 [Fonsecaea multimorphosa]
MTAVMEQPSGLAPGSYLPENRFSQLHCARFKASPFLPPPERSTPTPDSSSPSAWSQPRPLRPLALATGSALLQTPEDDQRQYSRKRPRLDTKSVVYDDTFRREALSPPPLVNTNYRIAGGLDTPTALNIQKEEDTHEFDYEIDCRPNRFNNSQKSSLLQPSSESYFPQTPAPDRSRSSNKRRLSPPAPPMKSWGKTVWDLTGGLAGKVFNFCWNTTFSGFYAGGGSGYKFDIGPADMGSSSVWTELDPKNDVFRNDDTAGDYSRRLDRDRTPVPGGFPGDSPEFIEDYMSRLSVQPRQENNSTPTVIPDQDSPSISRFNSWVVVDNDNQLSPSTESSPVRKKSRASTASLYASRPSPAPRHPSHPTSRPRLTPRSSTLRSSASYASPRVSMGANTSTTSSSQYQSWSSVPAVSAIDQDQNSDKPSKRPSVISSTHRSSLSASRRQSSASVATSPKPSPEVRKFEQKMRRKEAKQDATMNRFNMQLQAMIKEGQEALGSRVEVEIQDYQNDGDVDEGYFDGGMPDRDVMKESWGWDRRDQSTTPSLGAWS